VGRLCFFLFSAAEHLGKCAFPVKDSKIDCEAENEDQNQDEDTNTKADIKLAVQHVQ